MNILKTYPFQYVMLSDLLTNNQACKLTNNQACKLILELINVDFKRYKNKYGRY